MNNFTRLIFDSVCPIDAMEFRHSSLVCPESYDNDGLSDIIDLRQSDYAYLEDRGAIRAQHDWAMHVGPMRRFRGTLGPQYSFMSVSVPECIPERLEIISYANEFAFMHDGTQLWTSLSSPQSLMLQMSPRSGPMIMSETPCNDQI